MSDKPYGCGYCGNAFSSSSELTAHTKSAHPDASEYKYICHLYSHKGLGVPWLFKTREDLYWHKVNVHGETGAQLPYSCSICKLKFATKAEMDLHIATAHAIESFTCPYCCQKFGTKTALTSHILSEHNTVKTYRCYVCGINFDTREELDIHKSVVHGGGGSTPPDEGGQTPDDSTPPIDYVCSYCGQTFGNQYALNLHIKAKHGDIPDGIGIPDNGGLPTPPSDWSSLKPILITIGVIVGVAVLILVIAKRSK